ncbi:MAG TPA: hypothetical protein VE861_04455 [Gemmatimonadaceae bacterium]|nr:hypothetical protein [Gemmatimonadaceae bacterium]
MTIPPLQGGGPLVPLRLPLLTAPVSTGIPPVIGDDPTALSLPAPAPAPAGSTRDDAPIALAGRLEAGDVLPDTTKLALALESATRALQNGRAESVLAELDAVWSSQLASDSPWYLRTGALQLLGRTSDAEQVLRDAITRLPRSAAMLYMLGVHTAHRGQFDAARLASDHALALHPTESLLWLQRAALALSSGNLEAAASIVAQVQQQDPGFPAMHWLTTLSRLGEPRGRTPTPVLQRALSRQTPSSLAVVRATPPMTPAIPAPASGVLEAAVRYGLTLLESPTQSARTATQVSGAFAARDPAVTYAAELAAAAAAAAAAAPAVPAAPPAWDTLLLVLGAIVIALVPSLRIPALMLCGAAAMLIIARKLR